MSFSITINLTTQDIEHIKKLGQNIIITKELNGSAYSSGWVVISNNMLTPTITVSWNEIYGLFSQKITTTDSTTINMSAKLSNVVFGKLYTFNNYFTITGDAPDPSIVQVYEQNPDQPWSIGMYETVNYNGIDIENPLGSMTVGTNETETIKPIEKIYIYLGIQQQNQAIKISTIGEALTLEYIGPGSKKVVFNENNNTFVLATGFIYINNNNKEIVKKIN